jgi:hypothetical protein
MTLRKCIFVLMIIENGVFELFGATTEIIYKPLNCDFGGFYIPTRIAHGLLCTI